MKRRILSPDTSSVVDFVKEPARPGGIQTVFPIERNSLRTKGSVKELGVSQIVQASLLLQYPHNGKASNHQGHKHN
jgi:hypothetical protein